MGSKISFEKSDIHTDDINCVDWNTLDENLICTGSSDSSFCILDLRNLAKPIHRVQSKQTKTSQIVLAKFSNFDKNIMGIGSDSLRIYDIK